MVENKTFVEKLVHELTSSVSASLIFSQPVDKNGIVVIPVAKIRYGFGGGCRSPEESGQGMGMGLVADPIGFIEIRNHQATFKPIKSHSSLTTLIISSGLIGYLLLRAMTKLFKR